MSSADWGRGFDYSPSPMPGWHDWYLRVSAAYHALWYDIDIDHCIGLSLAKPYHNESMLAVSHYFWSDVLNAFVFGHGPMSPTLLDIHFLTCLDIVSLDNPLSPHPAIPQLRYRLD
ncbi:hypothetical protein GUJ93_ZPchr0013g35242 [Zizania palustris]|uniref:Aminotransferase-like plant mobile domain-containing protein n=1 Tax=Zizania palustris TaxID=103762 RepID=A0A8J5X1V5_ZIZPA|nr:hypothetical protein GUJ93_ZPchr0013g35242 [Zizania palustris]